MNVSRIDPGNIFLSHPTSSDVSPRGSFREHRIGTPTLRRYTWLAGACTNVPLGALCAYHDLNDHSAATTPSTPKFARRINSLKSR